MPHATPPTPARPGADAAWDRVVTRFLARHRGATRATYAVRLRLWTRWCATQHLDPLAVRRSDVEAWLIELAEAGRADATVAASFDAVASCYRWAHEDGLVDVDPGARLHRPKIDHGGQHRPSLSVLEFAAFLAAARRLGPREHAAAALLGMTGVRSASACTLAIGDISMVSGYMVASVVVKGRRRQQIPLPVPVLRALDEVTAGRTSGPVLLSAQGHPMRAASLRRMVARTGREAGITEVVTPHALRRTFASTGFLQGIPLRDVQVAMGHARPETTLIYDRARANLDRHAAHTIAGFLAGMAA